MMRNAEHPMHYLLGSEMQIGHLRSYEMQEALLLTTKNVFISFFQRQIHFLLASAPVISGGDKQGC